jgi:hypothetical protein
MLDLPCIAIMLEPAILGVLDLAVLIDCCIELLALPWCGIAMPDWGGDGNGSPNTIAAGTFHRFP